MPFLLPGASVSPWDIANSLILTMLLPLGIGLFIKARYEPTADHLQPEISTISSVAIMIGLVAILVMQFSTILGTGGILAAILFLLDSLGIGMLLGGKQNRAGVHCTRRRFRHSGPVAAIGATTRIRCAHR